MEFDAILLCVLWSVFTSLCAHKHIMMALLHLMYVTTRSGDYMKVLCHRLIPSIVTEVEQGQEVPGVWLQQISRCRIPIFKPVTSEGKVLLPTELDRSNDGLQFFSHFQQQARDFCHVTAGARSVAHKFKVAQNETLFPKMWWFFLLKSSFYHMLITGSKKNMWGICTKYCTRVGSKIGTQTKKSSKKHPCFSLQTAKSVMNWCFVTVFSYWYWVHL